MLPVRTPVRFNDPIYAELARLAEAKYGLPTGILDAIRTMGERSNANQVSSVGGRSVYQFIPATRRGMVRNYGIDPWKDAPSATEGAAALLAENHDRTGNWNDAVRMYHGGLDRRNWGRQNRAYANRIGNVGETAMGPSRYPAPYYGPDPLAPLPNTALAPEQPTQPVPVPGDLGPSASTPAASPVASRKRGGLLGGIGRILENVFMPEADSRYAAALRGGIWDAKANQALYKQEQAKGAADTAMAQAKLKNLLTKGEYQIVGNNVIHFPADGTAPEMITPPTTPSEHERLIDKWRSMDDSDPSKKLIERLLLGANAPDVLETKGTAAERAARIRAGATTGAATIRANAPSKTSSKPPQGFILDN
jgi:hypothetical protein